MSRRDITVIAFTFACVTVLLDSHELQGATEASRAKLNIAQQVDHDTQPNIIYILADDLGWNDGKSMPGKNLL
jgi:hypothetical protein